MAVFHGQKARQTRLKQQSTPMMRGFFLGLAVGPSCLVYCAPLMIPYLLGEDRGLRNNYIVIIQFLIGRFLGYIGFGLLAWALNRLFIQTTGTRELLFGMAYIVLAALLVWYSQFAPPAVCIAQSLGGISGFLKKNWPILLPLGLGFFTGLSLCPPFLLAFTDAVNMGGAGQVILFFTSFFLGTSLYFLPMPILGLLGRMTTMRIVAKLAALVISTYYLYLGIIMFIAGINKL